MLFAPRLIEPVIAVIHRLDAASTWAVDPPGTPSKGYDEVFKEFRVYDNPTRTESRQELTAIEVLAQVEQESYEALVATFGGDSPVTDTVLVLHRQDMLTANLIASDGRLNIPKGSRVSKLLNAHTREQLVPDFQDEFVFEARPRSWGFRGKMNLFVLYFYRRERLGEL